MIKITSKKHLFRRCGIAHPKGPVEYPDNKFSTKELEILQAEPMLTVKLEKNPEGDDPKSESKKQKPKR
jgi:hypothetical protein